MGHSLVQEFITDDFKTAVQTVLDQALQGAETENFEFPLITKNGVRIEVLLNATTRRDEQGNVIGVVGFGQDITARLAQEREYSKLIDSANAPIFGVDTLGRVNVWNQCAMRLVGYTISEVMGKVRSSCKVLVLLPPMCIKSHSLPLIEPRSRVHHKRVPCSGEGCT
jgi:PAS domain-containing protein